MQEREQRGVEYDERNRQRTTAGRRRLFLARKERHGAMNAIERGVDHALAHDIFKRFIEIVPCIDESKEQFVHGAINI